MRYAVLLPGIALLAIGQLLPWATVDAGQISQLEAGFGLPLPLAIVLALAAIAVGLLNGWRQLLAATATSTLALFAAYSALAAWRARPTIGAVHYGADATAGPALAVCIAGIGVLVVAVWLLVALSRRRSPRSVDEARLRSDTTAA